MMDKKNRLKIIENARNYLRTGYHCSEGILLASGVFYFPAKLPALMKIGAPFSGGVGGTQEELCGAFTGGLIVIGALYGRTDGIMNDEHCLLLSKAFRNRFLNHFGYLRCKDLRKFWIGKPGQPDCAELTGQATQLLLEILDA